MLFVGSLRVRGVEYNLIEIDRLYRCFFPMVCVFQAGRKILRPLPWSRHSLRSCKLLIMLQSAKLTPRQLTKLFKKIGRVLKQWLFDLTHVGDPFAEWTETANQRRRTVTGYFKKNPKFESKIKAHPQSDQSKKGTLSRIVIVLEILVLLKQARWVKLKWGLANRTDTWQPFSTASIICLTDAANTQVLFIDHLRNVNELLEACWLLNYSLWLMTQDFDVGFALKSTIEGVLQISLPMIICTDSKSLYDCLVRLGIAHEKRLMIDIMCLMEFTNKQAYADELNADRSSLFFYFSTFMQYLEQKSAHNFWYSFSWEKQSVKKKERGNFIFFCLLLLYLWCCGGEFHAKNNPRYFFSLFFDERQPGPWNKCHIVRSLISTIISLRKFSWETPKNPFDQKVASHQTGSSKKSIFSFRKSLLE